MIHRMLRFPAGWEWHVLQQARQQPYPKEQLPSRKYAMNQEQETDAQFEQHVDELKRLFPECASWIDACEDRQVNQIAVGESQESGPLLQGTLMVQVSESRTDIQPLHFWITRQRLITMHPDLRIPLRLQSMALNQKYDECRLAPEAFCLMLCAVLDILHAGLDDFEHSLGELEAAMRVKNRAGLIDAIFDRRYDLLHWNHLFLPIQELRDASKEAFMNELEATEAFTRITHKLERIDTLLKHYSLEIDTLISMDDAISSFRGNDIMKTLTIFTVLFLPATIIGTLWGTNFKWLPWENHAWGFIGMISLVIIITLALYLWLWKKGWTGDLLNRKKLSDLMSDKEPRTRTGRHSGGKRRRKTPSEPSSMMLLTSDSAIPSRSRRKRT